MSEDKHLEFNLYHSAQQEGTLNYNLPPQLYKDNGRSVALAMWDEKQAKKRSQARKRGFYA